MRKEALIFFSLFIFHFSFAQNWIWANHGNGEGAANAVTSDNNGNGYAVGYFVMSKIIFGSDTLINNGYSYNVFLVKYNSKGKQLWAICPRTNNDTNNALGFSAATDQRGNVFITGEFTDTIYFGSIKLVASPRDYYEAFIAKYDSNGNVLWAKCSRQKSGAVVQSFAIATDKSGDAYITGSTNDSVWFGGVGLHAGVFLTKYDTGGNVMWARCSGGTGVSSSYMTIIADEFNNVYFTGCYDAPISFGAYNLPFGSSSINAFLVKYDSAGNVKWATNSEGTSNATGVSVAAYGSNCVYLTGWYDQGTLNFGTDTLQTTGNSQTDVFLVKYDTLGKVIWAKNSENGGTTLSVAQGVATDNKGDIFLYGISDSNISFESDTLRSATVWKNANFIVEFDSSGIIICDTVIGNIGRYVWLSNAIGIAINPITQELYVGGVLDNSPYVFGNDTLSNTPGNYYPYVAKWRPCNDVTGINEPKPLTAMVSVYPNPNNGTFTIAVQNLNELEQMEVYNILGEKIYQAKINSDKTEINLNEQPQGIYFYRVLTETEGLIGSGKLIIEK